MSPQNTPEKEETDAWGDPFSGRFRGLPVILALAVHIDEEKRTLDAVVSKMNERAIGAMQRVVRFVGEASYNDSQLPWQILNRG